MNRKLWIPALALVITLLSGCAASGGADGDGAPLFGRNIFYTRTASDEEAFSHLEDSEDTILDEAVPLAGLPEEEKEEGWLLVRYARGGDGAVEPLWYRVWTEENCWSQENLPYEGTGWHPVIPVRPEAGALE